MNVCTKVRKRSGSGSDPNKSGKSRKTEKDCRSHDQVSAASRAHVVCSRVRGSDCGFVVARCALFRCRKQLTKTKAKAQSTKAKATVMQMAHPSSQTGAVTCGLLECAFSLSFVAKRCGGRGRPEFRFTAEDATTGAGRSAQLRNGPTFT